MLATIRNRASIRSDHRLSRRVYPFFNHNSLLVLQKHLMARHSPQRQTIMLRIAACLLRQTERTGLGQVFHAPCNILLDRTVAVQPDIFFVHNYRQGIIGRDQVYGIPDLTVDIQSGDISYEECKIRRKIYLWFGVPEVWLIDSDRCMSETFLWSELGYISTGIYGKFDRLSSLCFPEIRLILSEIFEGYLYSTEDAGNKVRV